MIGFIKYNRSEQAENLESRPNENHLLSVIARRVSRTGNPVKGVKIGEALVGDYEKMGLKRQPYRTALANLQKWGYITTRVTNRTTYARLCNSDVYDCNILHPNHQTNPKKTQEQPNPNHNQEDKNKELKNKEEEKEREKALSQIKELELEIEQLKTELKNKEKSPPKKESGQHEFLDLTPVKTYQVTPPKSELETGPQKPYEIFLSSYPFQKYNWSEKLKQIFLTYCEVKNEKSHRGYATAQIKMRLTEINEAIPKHEINWIEKLVTMAAHGAWASFQFDERIKDRKDKEQKDEQQRKANSTDKYQGLTLEESTRQALADGYYDKGDSDQNSDWAKQYFANDDAEPEQSF